jgi:Fe-S-cluster containining protein
VTWFVGSPRTPPASSAVVDERMTDDGRMSDDPMRDDPTSHDGVLAAGNFSSWLVGMQGAIRGDNESAVPCGGCTACCTSFQFVHIEPDESDTLARIPAELLFPAPRLPRGHVVLGYDERGHCPMLVDDQCSIYEHRPRTCRTYDCRIFPAAGLEIDDDDKARIARQSQRWQFSYRDQVDRTRHDAVRAAADFLEQHRELLADGGVPTNSAQVAALAVELHDAFVHLDDETGAAEVVDPDPAVVRAELIRRRAGTRIAAP